MNGLTAAAPVPPNSYEQRVIWAMTEDGGE